MPGGHCGTPHWTDNRWCNTIPIFRWNSSSCERKNIWKQSIKMRWDGCVEINDMGGGKKRTNHANIFHLSIAISSCVQTWWLMSLNIDEHISLVKHFREVKNGRLMSMHFNFIFLFTVDFAKMKNHFFSSPRNGNGNGIVEIRIRSSIIKFYLNEIFIFFVFAFRSHVWVYCFRIFHRHSCAVRQSYLHSQQQQQQEEKKRRKTWQSEKKVFFRCSNQMKAHVISRDLDCWCALCTMCSKD